MRPIEEFCCPNSRCPEHGQRGKGNLRLHGWSSEKQQLRLLFCRTCKRYFSQRKGTPLWHRRLPEAKALAVLEQVAEGCGVRQTARLVQVNKNTACRLAVLAGGHARRLHEERLDFSPAHRGGPVRGEGELCLPEGRALYLGARGGPSPWG